MNNWYVVTGAFSSGKSTLLAALAEQGHRTLPEAARVHIDRELARGRSLAEIRQDEAAFQVRVLREKLELEQTLPREELIFFDRGVPDSIAYLRLGGFDDGTALAASRPGVYRKIFLLDPLPFEQDYARTENQGQIEEIHRLLHECYLKLDYEVVRIPVEPVEARVKRVLAAL
jgi:predicted ATPase